MAPVVRRVVALCVCVVALASCRVDVSVDMNVEPDGTGTVAMQIVADPELIAEIPTIADELATDDIVAAGWIVDGPTATDDGGLTINFSHDFSSDEEATNLLNSLGPPFSQMSMVRTTVGDDTTTQLSGLLGLPDGFAAFADEELIAAVGSVPFADQLEAAGATPSTSMTREPPRSRFPGDRSRTDQRQRTRRRTTGVGRSARRHGPRNAGVVGPVARRQPVVGPTAVDHRPRRPDRLGGVHDAVHRLRRHRQMATIPPTQALDRLRIRRPSSR